MPVRKIPRSHTNVTGRHAVHGARSVGFESVLERDFITLMLFDAAFESIEEQPVKVPVPGGKGRAAYYVPDFLVHLSNARPKLVEVKPSDILARKADDFHNKFTAAKAFAGECGWSFEIWTEKNIRILRLENAKFLLPYRARQDVDHGLCAHLIRQLKIRGEASVSDLAEAVDDQEHLKRLTCLWHLISTNRVFTDVDVPLTADTVLSLPQEVRHAV